MAYRVLQVTLISAKDLKKVTLFTKMRVYSVASISGGDPRIPTHRTIADPDGGKDPTWGATFHFPITAGTDTRGLALHVLLRAERVLGDRDIGEVFVPLQDLLVGASDGGAAPKPVSYQVRRPMSGRAKGVLQFSYKFTDVLNGLNPEKPVGKVMEPVTAYPAAHNRYPPLPHMAATYQQAMPYGSPYTHYPPRPYGYVVAPGYGYGAMQPAPYGYTAPKVVAPGGMGMGLGLGLLGGAVGGMMLGDMIGDFQADAAYDAGFGDGRGF